MTVAFLVAEGATSSAAGPAPTIGDGSSRIGRSRHSGSRVDCDSRGHSASFSLAGSWHRARLAAAKARTLLKLLAVERRGLLSADRIADVLWDAAGGPPAEPGQAVATLVSRLRAVLGRG